MPWCQNCGKRSPRESDYIFENYDGDYFCGDECREITRARQE